ncbi:MAG: hypothetical protein QNK05_22555 [Myxococcota bacterium]|nr:hypothetical protein [Myxococcota bacterium]
MTAIDSALAGLRAAERKHTTAARNVADWAVEVASSSGAEAGTCVSDGSPKRVHGADEAVDLARSLVDQMLAGVGFRAALRVIETDAEMKGTLVDLKA